MNMPLTITSPVLAALVRDVCTLEVAAFKPGNVSVDCSGHGMTAQDFIASAEAAALPLTRAGLLVGERILGAIKATRASVGCNTNLGIVLLLAPLIDAAMLNTPENDLRSRLHSVLLGLTIHDAVSAYEAIRLASPGGLGESQRHDVNAIPQVTLLDAMREAQSRDRIARQYAEDYADVFLFGLPLLARTASRWESEEWSVVAVYLAFLGAFKDTHVERKFGEQVAERISHEAAAMSEALQDATDPQTVLPQLRQLDEQWKQAGINPGTSADLTVATFFTRRLQDMLNDKISDRTAVKAAGHYPRRALG